MITLTCLNLSTSCAIDAISTLLLLKRDDALLGRPEKRHRS
jgi:hypothetical protein